VLPEIDDQHRFGCQDRTDIPGEFLAALAVAAFAFAVRIGADDARIGLDFYHACRVQADVEQAFLLRFRDRGPLDRNRVFIFVVDDVQHSLVAAEECHHAVFQDVAGFFPLHFKDRAFAVKNAEFLGVFGSPEVFFDDLEFFIEFRIGQFFLRKFMEHIDLGHEADESHRIKPRREKSISMSKRKGR